MGEEKKNTIELRERGAAVKGRKQKGKKGILEFSMPKQNKDSWAIKWARPPMVIVQFNAHWAIQMG